MLKRYTILILLISCFTQVAFSQIPGLTITSKKDQKDLYLKTKTVWATLTPFFLVERKFSPDQGATWQKVGMFGKNIKPYVQEDTVAMYHLTNYKLTRVFGIAQMWVIAPILAYKHFTTEPGIVSTGNPSIDGSDVVLEEETGYLTAAIIVFCTGTITYHLLSKGSLFKTLERYNYVMANTANAEKVDFNMLVKLDQSSQTPQLSLVWTF